MNTLKMSPLVSIIIPAYNSCRFIRETVSSLLSQTIADIEVIVVDNGSTDHTLDILRGFSSEDKRVKVLVEPKRGVSCARNTGIRHARGQYIAFIDHDDIWKPDKLKKQIGLLNNDPQTGMVYCLEGIITPEGKRKGSFGGLGKPFRGRVFRELFKKHFIPISSVVVRREVFDKLDEWFPENMEMAEEVDLLLRIAYSWKVDYYPEELVFWRDHPVSDSKKRPQLLVSEHKEIIKRLEKKVPDFKRDFAKEIRDKECWVALTEIKILLSGGRRKEAFGKAGEFVRDFGFRAKALVELPVLFVFGYGFFDRLRAVLIAFLSRTGHMRFIGKKDGKAGGLGADEEKTLMRRTGESFGFHWLTYHGRPVPQTYHVNKMQEVIPEKIVRGKIGLEVGCGCGWDTFLMAKNNPGVKIVGMDLSDGVYVASELNKVNPNAGIVRGSATNLPFRDEGFDFVYSFGVLHHVPDYRRCFHEARRVLKKGAPCFLYLYEDHSEDRTKYFFIKAVSALRKVTTGMTPKALRVFSYCLSPFVVVVFTFPAKLFRLFRATRGIYERMPFNFGSGLFSVAGDLYDRFSAPVEHRFGRQELLKFMDEIGFRSVGIGRLKATAGWVVWGTKG